MWKEYVALVCERVQHALGHLFLLDLCLSRICEPSVYPIKICIHNSVPRILTLASLLAAEEKFEYRLRLVGQQSVELPCYSLCIVKLPDTFSYDSIQTAAEEAYAPSVLRQDANRCVNGRVRRGVSLVRYCLTDSYKVAMLSRALVKKAQTGAILALGSRGKVHLLSVFVVQPDISSSLLAALSGAVDAALPFHDGTYKSKVHPSPPTGGIWSKLV